MYVKVAQPIPDEWPLIVGDVLTNLRAALDHALFGHVTARHPLTPQQERGLQFPILTNRDMWVGNPAATNPNRQHGQRGELAVWCDPKVLDVIEDVQPFNAANPDQHVLKILNELVNFDKHRSLRVVTYATHDLRVTRCPAKVVKTTTVRGEMVDGTMIGTVIMERPNFGPGASAHDRLLPLDVDIDYAEEIHLPVPGINHSLVTVIENVTSAVEKTLNTLRSAGC